MFDPIGRKLYEFYRLTKTDAGWHADGAAIFDLASNKLRPDGWTSSDAAGGEEKTSGDGISGIISAFRMKSTRSFAQLQNPEFPFFATAGLVPVGRSLASY